MTDQSSNSTNYFINILRGLGLGVVAVIALFGLLLGLWQVDAVKNQVLNSVVKKVNERLLVPLSINKVRGSLISDLKLSGIQLGEDLHIDSVIVNYSLLDLISSDLKLKNLKIVKPEIRLQEATDTTFWVQHLIKETQNEVDSLQNKEESTGSITMNSLEISQGSVLLIAPNLTGLKQTELTNFSVQAGFSFGKNGISGKLKQIESGLVLPNFEDTLQIVLNGEAKHDRFILTKLLLGTGKSALEMNASLDKDSLLKQVSANMSIKNLSKDDLTSLQETSPIKEDIQAELSFSLENMMFEIALDAQSESIKKLKLTVKGIRDKQFSLSLVKLELGESDFQQLLGLDKEYRLKTGLISAEGFVPLNAYKSGNFSLKLFAQEVRLDSVQFEELKINGNLERKNWTSILSLKQEKSFLEIRSSADSVFYFPKVISEISLKEFNLFDLYSSPKIKTRLNGTTKIIVKTEEKFEQFDFTMISELVNSEINGFEISALHTSFDLRNAELRLKSNAKISDSNIEIEFNSANIFSIPQSSYNATVEHFDLSTIPSLDSIKTDLNITIDGECEGSHIDSLKGYMAVNVGNSKIGLAEVESFNGVLSYENQRLNAENMTLRSDFADIDLTAEGSYTNLKDSTNTLNLAIYLKNTSPLTRAVFGKSIKVKGGILLDIKPIGNSIGMGVSAELDNLKYENNQIEAMELRAQLNYSDWLDYDLFADLHSPIMFDLPFHDLALRTTGTLKGSVLRGDFESRIALKKDNATALQMSYYGKLKKNELHFGGKIIDGYFQSIRRNFSLANEVNWAWKPNYFVMDTLLIKSGRDAYLSLWAGISDTVSLATIRMENLDMLAAYSTFLKKMSGEALITGNLALSMMNNDLSVHSNLKVSPLQFKSIRIDSLFFATQLVNEKVSLQSDWFTNNKDLLHLNAHFPFRLGDPNKIEEEFFERPVHVDLAIPNFSLFEYSELIDSLGYGSVFGTINAGLSIRGKADSPKLTAFIFADTLQLANALIDSIRTYYQFEAKEQLVKAEGKIFSLNRKVADFIGSVPLHLNYRTGELNLPKQEESFNARILTDKFDINAFNDFLDNYKINNLTGLLTIDAGLQGEIQKPYFDGSIELNKGSVELIENGIFLREIETKLDFTNEYVNLSKLNLKSNSGTFDMNGSLYYDRFEIKNSQIDITAKDFQLINTKNLKVQSNASLKLSGKPENFELTGKVSLKKSDVFLENFGEKTIEDVYLDEQEVNHEYILGMYNNLTAQVKVTIERDVWVRNREYPELNVELSGSSDLIKNKNEDFHLFGTFNTRRGYAKQFSKRFNLDTGSFTFSGNPENPAIHIETSYELRKPKEIKIWYIIGGTAEKPTFTFKSDPVMEKEDIVSYTLFGRPFATLMGWQQGVTGQSTQNGAISDMAVGVLLDRIESYATEKFGIDVIEIDNSSQASGSGTSIRAGKYINDKTFIAIVQQLGGTDPVSQVVLEYLLRQNLDLILTQSSDESSGVDLRWKFEY